MRTGLRITQIFKRSASLEDSLSVGVLASMSVLPIVEIAGRKLIGRGIPGSIVLVQHLTLWIALLGAALAARSDRLLALSTPRLLPRWIRPLIQVFTFAVAVAVSLCLLLASLDMVRIEREAGDLIPWGIPLWAAVAVLPVGFAAITARLIWHAAESWKGRSLAASGLLGPAIFMWAVFPDNAELLVPVGLLILLLATALGMPIFAGIAGAALLLFWADGTPINAVPYETYDLTTEPLLPAIPLFALGGYILAEGRTSQRLMRLFTALVGWVPGGLAIVVTLVLAFFTPLTGASGITILAMGGLLLPILLEAHYPRNTSVGLMTVSGSIGLLFFPSLPVFLYAFYARQPYEQLFVGGLLPGILLVSVVAGWGASQGWLNGATRTTFRWQEAARATWQVKWELLLPVIILGSIFFGFATLVEAAALSVVYAFLIQCFVHKDLRIGRDLPRVFTECATLLGGFLIILCVALGFTSYLIIAQVPMQALDWVQSHIESSLLFLLALNIFLILVGALMDIYSAIVVVVPLVYPMAEAYGIDPVHLGIIFLANMELGYLMPPMGENLFLSAFRFEQPLGQIYRSTLPFVIMLLIAVLLITYVPLLTLGPVELFVR